VSERFDREIAQLEFEVEFLFEFMTTQLGQMWNDLEEGDREVFVRHMAQIGWERREGES
jgi:hypothetical protein